MAELVASRMRQTLDNLAVKNKAAEERIKSRVNKLVSVLSQIEEMLNDDDTMKGVKGMEGIMDLIYKIEDTLESWAVKVEAACMRKSGTKSILGRCFGRHDDGTVSEEDIIRWGVFIVEGLLGWHDNISPDDLAELGRHAAEVWSVADGSTQMSDVEENFVRKKDLNNVITLVKEKRAVWICGVEGMGKTSLAREVYYHDNVRTSNEAFAWVSFTKHREISSLTKHREISSLLQNILNQLVGEEQKKGSGDSENSGIKQKRVEKEENVKEGKKGKAEKVVEERVEEEKEIDVEAVNTSAFDQEKEKEEEEEDAVNKIGVDPGNTKVEKEKEKGAKAVNKSVVDQKQQLIIDLKNIQRRNKCFIVIDHMWTSQWEEISSAFDCKETRILLTTPHSTTTLDAVLHEDKVFVELEPLDEEEGWNLLQELAFRGKSVPEKGIAPKLAKEMLRKCDGLPLKICRLGRILRDMDLTEWHKVSKDVEKHLQRDYNNTQSDEVPFPINDQLNYRKKQCFLFLAIFKGNEDVDSEDLKLLWIAEGMVSPHHLPTMNEAKHHQSTMGIAELQQATMNGAKHHQSTMEITELQQATMNEAKYPQPTVETTELEPATMDIAENYVQELANNLAANGSFKLHLWHLRFESSLYYGVIKNFRLKVLDFSRGWQPTFVASYVRRLAIHLDKCASYPEKYDLYGNGISFLRSLFFLNSHQQYAVLPVRIFFKEFELLRVLHFVRCKFDGRKLPKGIDELYNLRYLGVLYCDLDELPASIRNLRNLHILNVKAYHDAKITIPNAIYGMAHLKHLRLPDNLGGEQSTMWRHRENSVHEQSNKLKFDGLHDLESLDGFNADIHDIESLCKLEKLRHLVAYANSNDSLESITEFFYDNGDRVRFRTKLYVESKCNFTSEEGLIILEEVLTCPNLHSLTLSLVRVDEFPTCESLASEDLTEIKLIGCKLSKDPMKALGNFPNLQKLCFGYGSFVGKEMTIDGIGFPKLEYLELSRLSNLEQWTAAEGAMKSLLSMTVNQCPNLNQSTFDSSLNNLQMVSEQGNNDMNEMRRYLKKSHIRSNDDKNSSTFDSSHKQSCIGSDDSIPSYTHHDDAILFPESITTGFLTQAQRKLDPSSSGTSAAH